jgi:transcriptional antiterminator RfaH
MFQTRTDDQLRWYCVHTKPKSEHIASAHIAHLEGVEVFCPRIRFQRKTRRGKVWFNEALFPGYTFARFRLNEHLRAVNGSQAVLRVVRFGENSYPCVPDQVIADWQCAVDDRKLITIEEQFQPGDEVEIIEGPMQGIRTIITQVYPAQERVRILLELLGEVREVQVSLDAVCKKQNIRLASPEVSG